MLSAFKGRINRKTFVLGNIVGLCVLGFAGLIYIVPLAVIDIVVNGSNASAVFKFLYSLFVIPAIFYLFFFSVLFVKRLHDIGYPGMLILWALALSFGLARVLDIWLLNVVGILILGAVVTLPGQPGHNGFGSKPPRKFKPTSLIIHF